MILLYRRIKWNLKRLSTLPKNLSWTVVELELQLAVCLQSCGLNDTVSCSGHQWAAMVEILDFTLI